ncbi:DUF5684 domain-containing protein [Paraflavitalea sp. CAU 1676]|nr:DUF5684 domain-containing protein [Paraflavitalea sp. CAU 1676]
MIASQWKIFEKAGQPGWACLVPFYNLYILLKIVGKPTWWMIMFFIPIINIIFLIWATNMLSKSFGKDEGFTAGLILLGIVFYPMLGFGSAVYKGPFGDPKAFELAQKPQFDFEQNR